MKVENGFVKDLQRRLSSLEDNYAQVVALCDANSKALQKALELIKELQQPKQNTDEYGYID